MTSCVLLEPIYSDYPLDDLSQWTSGARSVVSFVSDCWYGWDVNAPAVGTAVGLNDVDQNTTALELNYGFIFIGAQWFAIDQGEVLEAVFGELEGRFYLVRTGGDVLYCIRNPNALDTEQFFDVRYPGIPLPGTLVYVSPFKSLGQVFLDTALYQQGDGVENEASGRFWQSFTQESPVEDPSIGPSNPVGSSAANGGSIYGTLNVIGTGVDDLTSTEGVIDGQLTITGSASSRSLNGVEGEIPIVGIGWDSSIATTGGGITGEFTITGGGTQQGLTKQGVHGYFTITGGGDSKEVINQGCNGELRRPRLYATGTDDVETPIDEWIQGELYIEGGGQGSPAPLNEFVCVIAFDSNFDIPLDEYDVVETIQVATEVLPILISKVMEAIQVQGDPQSFYNPQVDLVEYAVALASVQTKFILSISETYNITDSLTVDQVMLIAEQLTAAGTAETVYTGVAMVLAGILCDDGKISGGSAVGETAGVFVSDPGPPQVVFKFTGYWPAGTYLALEYTTDVSTEVVATTLPYSMSGDGVMTYFTALLDAEPNISATFNGTEVTITASGAATTVQI